mmetsp:Transcript_28142/g.84023  ORF Transcript_28142/g.84023 Transcript_28142/m.84023 type:complete len:317 (+) Transcript_28142:41-991(+)
MLVFRQPSCPPGADASVRFRVPVGGRPQPAPLGRPSTTISAHGDRQQPFARLAALAAPLWLALAAGARRPARAARARAASQVVRCAARRIPSRAAGATLKSRIWDMLGLHPRANKDEIRRAYKEYVRLSHPDLNGGKVDKDFAERFRKLSAAYNEVMNMSDDQFWLESFDTGITRMATKRVDGPFLNPWERRFRQWARANDLLDIDKLTDDDVDCRKRADLYLDRCNEDPTAEGCEVVKSKEDALREWEAAVRVEEEADPERPATAGGPALEAAAPKEPSPLDWIRLDQILMGGVFTVGAAIMGAFIAIVANAVQG